MMTDAALTAKLAKLKTVHPTEIGLRVGQAEELIEEVLRLRAELRIYKPQPTPTQEKLATLLASLNAARR